MPFSQTPTITKKYVNDLSYQVIGAAIEVHKYLGPCLLESVYKHCLQKELDVRGLTYTTEENVSLNYKGIFVPALLRYDLLVEDLIIVELKAIESLLPIHEATTLSYMKLMYKPKGVLINFHCTNIWKEGQKTLVNNYYSALPDE